MDPAAKLALLARAVGDLKDAVLITEGTRDAHGVRPIIFVNRAFTEMTGFSESEAIGQLPDITVGPDTNRDALRRIQAARDALQPVRVELLKYKKDQSTFWAELDIVPVVDDERRCTHFLGVMRDVTERRLAHSRLIEADRLAALGTLAAGIAHEINNPLTSVLTNLQFLDDEVAALRRLCGPDAVARAEEALREARQGAQRVAQIVKDVRTFSRVEADAPGLVDLEPILRDAIHLARTGMPTSAPVVERFESLVPVAGDRDRLSHVFLNLILNALQAVPPSSPGKVEVHAFLANGRVVVDVNDDGVGISPEILPRIFEPFFTTKAPGSGSGLGLSVTRSIIIGLGGDVAVESDSQRGTKVRVTLPAATPPRAEETSAVARSMPRMRVLVIDDDSLVRRALARFLSRRHDVVECGGARDALEILAGDRVFDVVLCDLTMPGMDGAAFYREVTRRWPGFEQKVVMMSGGASTEEGRLFLESLPHPWLEKPATSQALEAVFRRAWPS